MSDWIARVYLTREESQCGVEARKSQPPTQTHYELQQQNGAFPQDEDTMTVQFASESTHMSSS